jgi:pyruvate dehydrogenase E2 component (dihydrolipoamide acetyltransferase)
MATEIKLPELSENAKEGSVTGILVKVGDVIKTDQNLLEVEAGKATVEIPSPVAGTVTSILIKEGEKAKVGQVMMTIDEAAAGAAPKAKAPVKKEEPSAAQAKAAAPAPAAPAPAPAPAVEAAPAPVKAAAPRPAAPSGPVGKSTASVPASPSTRQFAREIGVDINGVSGTEPGGRVSVEDVKRYSRENRASGGGGPIAANLPDFGRFGEIEVEPLNNVRLATAQQMAVSWSNVVHVTLHESVDITEIENLRKTAKSKAEAAGTKLTLTAFLIKIIASALKVYPKFNTSIDLANNQLIYKKYFNIGVAMDTERGLIVPVIRNVDSLNVIKIAQEIGKFAERAKARKVTPDEMQGGSITITNLGNTAGQFFTPIVNFPEVAILGVGRATMQPVVVNGFFQPRLMLPLSLSFDHRVIDGADGARFLRWIMDAIQQPVLLSLEG